MCCWCCCCCGCRCFCCWMLLFLNDSYGWAGSIAHPQQNSAIVIIFMEGTGFPEIERSRLFNERSHLLGVHDCLLGVPHCLLGVPDYLLGVLGYGLGVPDSYWAFSAMDWAFPRRLFDLGRPKTKRRVLRATSSTLKFQFTVKCWKVDFLMSSKTRPGENSKEKFRMVRALLPDTPRPPQIHPKLQKKN